MRTIHVARRWGLHPTRWAEVGRPTWDDFAIKIETGLWKYRPEAMFSARAALRVNECDTTQIIDGWQEVAIPVVAIPALARVLHVALAFDTPDGSRATFRLLCTAAEGDDGARWWDGSAWSAPADDDQWNTAADVQAHVSAWPHRSLGVAAALRSDDGQAVPSFFGMDAHLELELARDSGDASLPSDAVDATIVRGILAAIRAGVEVWDVDEFVAPAVEVEVVDDVETPLPSTIDYSDGQGATTRPVVDVAAVYDCTDDPDRMAPLAGTWDAGAQVWTAYENLVEGHRISVRLRVDPLVAFTADKDRFTEHLPCINLEGLREDRRVPSVSRSVLIDEATQEAHVLEGPDLVDLLYDAACIGEDVAEACDLSDAFCAWAGSARRLLIPALAQWHDLVVAGPGTTGARGDLAESVVTMRVSRVPRYAARERSVPYAREFDVDTRECVNRA